MNETFRPVSHQPPDTLVNKIKFYGRMVLDLQILTIYKDIRKTVKLFKGEVLDVGCGQSPYRFLLDSSSTRYFGIDIVDADKFDYKNADITPFNGSDIPFENEKFDGLICTEVLEHVYDFQVLINEMHRVMKTGGDGIVTIPWSARYHYIPHDFFRYTPSSLLRMFDQFKMAKVIPRGSVISNVANKLIVIWFSGIFPVNFLKIILSPLWLLSLPLLGIIVLIAHLSIFMNLGSQHDPLGYTIIIRK